MRIGFLRHGPTEWNAAGRIQGRSDIPLSPAGREQVARYILPREFAAAPAYVSPLLRAEETARFVGCEARVQEPALIEMNWGAWEGETLAALRDRYGAEMKANEARGLDFRPEGGESPREVQDRLRGFLDRLRGEAAAATRCLCITHKGVIRAAIALAYDWDMTGKAPVRLDWAALHVVRLDPDGTLRPDETNVSLLR